MAMVGVDATITDIGITGDLTIEATITTPIIDTTTTINPTTMTPIITEAILELISIGDKRGAFKELKIAAR